MTTAGGRVLSPGNLAGPPQGLGASILCRACGQEAPRWAVLRVECNAGTMHAGTVLRGSREVKSAMEGGMGMLAQIAYINSQSPASK
jgi:hypothetical protein